MLLVDEKKTNERERESNQINWSATVRKEEWTQRTRKSVEQIFPAKLFAAVNRREFIIWLHLFLICVNIDLNQWESILISFYLPTWKEEEEEEEELIPND